MLGWQCLDDGEAPVRFAAATAVRFVIGNPACKEIIAPVLPALLTKFFQLAGELEADDVMTTLSHIVHEFSDQLTPIAPQLISKYVSCHTLFACVK